MCTGSDDFFQSVEQTKDVERQWLRAQGTTQLLLEQDREAYRWRRRWRVLA
jgi:hypothetical protein